MIERDSQNDVPEEMDITEGWLDISHLPPGRG